MMFDVSRYNPDGSALWTLTAWLGALSGPSKYREREERRSKTHFVEEVRRTASLDTFRLVWAGESFIEFSCGDTDLLGWINPHTIHLRTGYYTKGSKINVQ